MSEQLAGARISHTLCVATEYGEVVLKQHPLVQVHQGRMDRKEIQDFIAKGKFGIVIDATHPYAQEVTQNIKEAVEELKETGAAVSYFRLKRETGEQGEGMAGRGQTVYFKTVEDCVAALEKTQGNILLTTGSKELAEFCSSEGMKSRLYVRVLPSTESLSQCEKQGICGKHVIAMQGPFCVEMNEAVIRQYQISCLVTKESGISGGYQEKLAAARKMGIPVFVIGHPGEEEGFLFPELCRELERICGRRIAAEGKMYITLAGAGMGNENCLTREVYEAIRGADILLGAERMLEGRWPRLEKRPIYQADQIISYLRGMQERNLFPEDIKVVILFSGDSGFYSGCRSLYSALETEIREGRLRACLKALPGISSVSYLASCVGESYQDVPIYSIHGKKLCNLVRKIKAAPKTFLLTSGVKDVNWLGEALLEAGMPECEVITGYQLSYEGQQIKRHTPLECCELKEEGLYTCLVKNPYAARGRLTHGIRDEEFIRDQVPMTKEEIREVSICKLHLREGSVVYDIGSGTGSIAVEIAALSDDIQVYAVERREEALSLAIKNKERFGLENITVRKAAAPEGLEELPAATHAFIGGSGGKLKEILGTLYRINPQMRVVVNAISLETICEIREALSLFAVTGEETVQLQVGRARKAGSYHLMQAENPVWVCSFDFQGK